MAQHDTPTQKNELTVKQRQVALLLAEGNTAVQAAERSRVSRRTIERWKHQEAFKEAIRTAEDQAYRDSLALLKRSSRAAVMTLISCLSEKTSSYVRVASASKLLDLGLEVHRIADLEQRIAVMELSSE